jgi:esterase/lipase
VYLAQELSFDGLILVGMPLRFRRQRSYRTLYYAYRALGKRYQRKWYQQSLDPQIRRERPNYDRIPLACVRDAAAAIEWSRAALPAVRCPVLAIQSTTDHALDEQNMNELISRLGSQKTEIRWVPNLYHVVLIDHGKEEIFRDIHRFITAHTPAP